MKRCLIIFAKEPQPGHVKTRLNGYLSSRQCVNLYKAFLKDTAALARQINCEIKILAYDSAQKTPCYLKRIFPDFIFHQQVGSHLGQRMHQAFKFAKRHRAARAIIIGSDSPTLPSEYIGQAFVSLETTDIVLGPSHDGGYYLLGLKNSTAGLYHRISWSTPGVFQNTVRNIRRLKKNLAVLKPWYDVDSVLSLFRLKRDLAKIKSPQGQWTRRFLKKIRRPCLNAGLPR